MEYFIQTNTLSSSFSNLSFTNSFHEYYFLLLYDSCALMKFKFSQEERVSSMAEVFGEILVHTFIANLAQPRVSYLIILVL